MDFDNKFSRFPLQRMQEICFHDSVFLIRPTPTPDNTLQVILKILIFGLWTLLYCPDQCNRLVCIWALIIYRNKFSYDGTDALIYLNDEDIYYPSHYNHTASF